MAIFFHEAKINQCALVYKRLNGVCPNYMLELLKRNIDNVLLKEKLDMGL